MGINSYTGSQKAAILLLSFGEEISAEIFKHFNEFEIKRVGTAMSRLGRLDEADVDAVVMEFYNVLQQNRQFLYGGSEYTKKVLGAAFKGGEDVLEQLSISSAHLDSLTLIEPKTLAGFVRNEHPQTIALILAHLHPQKMGETLKLLPEALHSEILIRIANLDSVSPELIEEIEDVLKQEVQTSGSIALNRIGGVEHLANMVNMVDKVTEEQLLNGLEERDPELAEEVRSLMFVFDDLVMLDKKGMQEVIKAVPQDKWKIALRSAADPVKDLVFGNMSERAATMLREDMETQGAVKLSDVEKSQQEILQIVRKLEEEGKVVLGSEDNAYV